MAIEKCKATIKPRAKKVKPDFLPDALIEGNFAGQVGSKLVVSRLRSGKNTFSVCVVKQLEEDSGLIHTYDETIEQWFTFSTREPPDVVKLLTK